MVDELENQNKNEDNGFVKVSEEETLLSNKDGLTELKAITLSKTSPSNLLEDITLQASEDTTCGIGCIRGKFFQRFANKNSYALIYGILGCFYTSTYSYMNGTITTLEKRFKIPSTNTGIILVGSDFTTLTVGFLLNYYGAKGHRPRWIAFGILTVVGYCLINALCHLVYGPGEDALDLTKEYGGDFNASTTALLIDAENRKALCQDSGGRNDCITEVGNFAPQVILFCAQLVGGVGGSLYYTLGVAYMDDNSPKSKSPLLVSFSFFLRMLGPVMGYTLASACLTIFISPSLTPTVTKRDPRWLGAWWLGWLGLALILAVFAFIIALYPKTLPKTAARRELVEENRKTTGIGVKEQTEEVQLSLKDMMTALKRLIRNPAFMCNNFASIFFLIGFSPYWIFMSKYIETIFRQSASYSSFIIGTLTLVCAGVGIMGSGLFISKAKPSARFLAIWNVIIAVIIAMGIFTYSFLGCPLNKHQAAMINAGQMETTACNQDCNCNFVKYSPVCAPDGRTFVSPCHAGCNDYRTLDNGTKVYLNCSCVPAPFPASISLSLEDDSVQQGVDDSWVLTEGFCPVDCGNQLIMFLAAVCVVNMAGFSGRTGNFLISIRCVDEADKTLSMALGLMFLCIFAFIPSPVLFGHIIDTTCIVWGKTCTGTGNCWLYDADKLRYLMNFTAVGFISVGCVFDVGLTYFVKDLIIFDDDADFELPVQRSKKR